MHNFRKIKNNVYYVGASDRRIELFENIHHVSYGMSYNSYLVKDDETVLFDTVDISVANAFFENLAGALGGRYLDYCVIDHMEPDHAATLAMLAERYPETRFIGNAKTFQMLGQFFPSYSFADRCITVKDGDTLKTGEHEFTFVMAPMVHWPEAMVSYDALDKILFSADAFGTFGALSGNLFADESAFYADYWTDARRYYTNIVGKYGPQTLKKKKKAEALDIDMICPLHGPIIRENIYEYILKYRIWGSYEPELNSVCIFCGSIYGDTMNVSEILASTLADDGVRGIALYDVSKTDTSRMVAEAFRYSTLVFSSVTYNNRVFPPMGELIDDIAALGLRNRSYAVIENGTWAPSAGDKIDSVLSSLKGFEQIAEKITIRSAPTEIDAEIVRCLGHKISRRILH